MNINWQACALNIRQAGISLARAADRCGMDQATLQRLARGEIREPRFSQGVKLLDLHLDLCGDKHKELLA